MLAMGGVPPARDRYPGSGCPNLVCIEILMMLLRRVVGSGLRSSVVALM